MHYTHSRREGAQLEGGRGSDRDSNNAASLNGSKQSKGKSGRYNAKSMRKEMNKRGERGIEGRGLGQDKGQRADGGRGGTVKWAACYTLHNNDV